ncbi:DUF3329 domain-containing protein [Mycolicibacterium wolinskyi]|uniref:DUF3329 domain-containing protein n=1 Tax=Mycolicibacterium wolinskyi TaxID=59750 RepID=UPI00399A5D40
MSVTTDKDTDKDTELDDKEVEETADDVDEPSEEVDSTDEKADPAEESDDKQVTERRSPRKVLIGAVGAVLIAVLAGAGYLGWQLWQQQQVERAGQAAQQAAAAYAAVLTSIDTAKVDENFTQVLDGATGEFKDMYSKSATELRQLLIDNKASAHGVVLESAVQSATKDKVVVLLFVDQSVSNTHVPDPRIDRSRIKMTMENVDGRWRASKVELP